MILTTTTTHKLKFSIQACWNEEGGMGSDSYGPTVETIEEAVHLLMLANISIKNIDWFIRVDVTTNHKKS